MLVPYGQDRRRSLSQITRSFANVAGNAAKRVMASGAGHVPAAVAAMYAGSQLAGGARARSGVRYSHQSGGGSAKGSLTLKHKKGAKKSKFKLKKKTKKAIRKMLDTRREVYMREVDTYPFCVVSTALFPQPDPAGDAVPGRVGWRALELIFPIRNATNQISSSEVQSLAGYDSTYFAGADSGWVYDPTTATGVSVNYFSGAASTYQQMFQKKYLFDVRGKLFFKNNMTSGCRVDVWLVKNTHEQPYVSLATALATSSNPLGELYRAYIATHTQKIDGALNVDPAGDTRINQNFQQFFACPHPVSSPDKKRFWKVVSHAVYNLASGDEVRDSIKFKYAHNRVRADTTLLQPKGQYSLVIRVEGDISHGNTAAGVNNVEYGPIQVDCFYHKDLTVYETSSSKYVSTNRVGAYVSRPTTDVFRVANDANIKNVDD